MAADPKTLDRARDELFSHINRCGVLQAAEDDQKNWMDETIDYLGERYPELSQAELQDLHSVGIRFCMPAIRNGVASSEQETEQETETESGEQPAQVSSSPEAATVAGE